MATMGTVAAATGTVHAQTETLEGETEKRLDVITVTSQFREQSVLEVPIAVTAYQGEFIDRIGIDEFDELSAFVPGLVVQEQSVNNPGFVIRGITSDDGASTIEQRVSVFQNGVSISRSRGSVVPFFDLERVEVLNGPQGTLFGRSAQIGAVHIVSNKAEHDFNGAASLELGNFDHAKATGHINLPIIDDKLALRLAAFHEERNGYTENVTGPDLNGVDTSAVRASLRFDPMADLRFDLISNYVTNNPSGTSFKSGVIPALGGDVDPNTFASLNAFAPGIGDLEIDRELFDVTLIADWALSDSLKLISTSAYREFDSLENFDPDGTALSIIYFAEDAEAEQVSTDLRLEWNNGGALEAFFGAGYFKEQGTQSVPLGFDLGGLSLFSSFGAVPDPAELGADVMLTEDFGARNFGTLAALLTGDPAVFPPTGLQQTEYSKNLADNTSYDVFAEVSYDILDNLEIILGTRYTKDEKESGFEGGLIAANPVLLGAVRQGTVGGLIANGVPAEVAEQLQLVSVLTGVTDGVISSDDQAGLETDFDGFSWRAVVNYEVLPGKFAYFNYSRGRRPEVVEEDFTRDSSDFGGNQNGVIGDAIGQFVVVPEETVDSFELGFKGQFLDDALTFQTALYYYDYENFQTSVAVNEPGAAPEFDLINAGNASSFGWESSIFAQPTDSLEIFATYGFNESRFDENGSDGKPQEFANNQFRLSPDHAFSLGASYTHDLDGGHTLFVRPTYTWQSEVYFDNDNSEAFNVLDPAGELLFTVPALKQEAFGLANINAGVELSGGPVVEVYVKNLFDEEYIIDAGNTGAVFKIPTFIAGAPRFYGLRVKMDF